VEICKENGILISFFDRREEPQEIKEKEGMAILWGIRRAVEEIGRAPDVVYDEGDIWKAPMIYLFGPPTRSLTGPTGSLPNILKGVGKSDVDRARRSHAICYRRYSLSTVNIE
jgi:hypothetical protein